MINMDEFRSPRSFNEVATLLDRLSVFIKTLDQFRDQNNNLSPLTLNTRVQSCYYMFMRDFDLHSIAMIDQVLEDLAAVVPDSLKQDSTYVEVLNFFEECKAFKKRHTIEQDRARLAFRETSSYGITILSIMSNKSNPAFSSHVVLKLKSKLQDCRSEMSKAKELVIHENEGHEDFAKILRELSDTCNLIATYTPLSFNVEQEKVDQALTDYEVILMLGVNNA